MLLGTSAFSKVGHFRTFSDMALTVTRDERRVTGPPRHSPLATPHPTLESPVDIERLLDFTDGNQENLRELVDLYLKQTSQQLEELEAAVLAGNAPEVRRLAHSCAGASATCGMRRLVPLLRELERQGCDENLVSSGQLGRQATQEFETIRTFLEDYLATHGDLAART